MTAPNVSVLNQEFKSNQPLMIQFIPKAIETLNLNTLHITYS